MRTKSPQINVLLIEDDEDEYVIIRDLLAEVPDSRFHLFWVEDFEAGLKAVSDGKYDICLLDYLLGHRNGLEFIREAKKNGSTVPIIFLTGWENLETDLQAMKEGASDYLLKGQVNSALLDRSIRYAIERNRREAELQRYKNRLEELLEERTLEATRARSESSRRADQLRESEDRFRTLADNMSQFAWMADEKGWIFWYNKRWYEYTGTTLEQMEGWGWKKVHHPDHVDRVVEQIQRSWDTGEPWEDVFPLRGKDGLYRWFLSRALPIRDEIGRIVRWFGTNTDITDQKRAEEDLRRSRELLSEAESLSHTGAWEWDLRADQWSFSDEWLSIHGCRNRALTGDELLLIAHPEDRETVSRAFEDVREGVAPYDLEHRIVRQDDGEVRVVHARGRFVRDESGRVVKVYGFAQDITDQKRTEEALKLTQMSVDVAGEMIGWTTPDGKIFYVNDATCRSLGYSRDEIMKMSLFDLNPDLTPERHEQIWQEVRERKSFTVETTHRRKDGSVYPAEMTVHHILYEGREYRVAFGRDITDRKRIEEALRKSEAQYRALFENMAEGFALGEPILDANGKPIDFLFVEINQGFERQTGLTREALGKPMTRVLPNLEEHWIEVYSGVALTGHPVRFEDYNKDLDKHFDVYCYSPAEGRFAIIFRDVTEEKRTQEALLKAHDELEIRVEERTEELRRINQELREHKEVLQSIFDNVPVMISSYHPSGDVPLLNKYALEVMGLSQDDLRHVDVMEKCYPDPAYRQEVFGYMSQATRGAWKDIKMVVRDGRTIDTLWSNVRLSDGSYIGIGVDVTERKQAEEALKRYTARLEALNRDLEDFTFISAHDLQEPLRKIQVFSDLVLRRYKDILDHTGRDYLQRLTASAKRMQDLIQDIRLYSRVTSDSFAFKTVDLNRIAEEALSDLELRIKEANACIQVEELPTVEADSTLMRLLLQNLLGNALKYRDHEAPSIRISSRKLEEDVQITVKDNGIGFDERYAELIFKPFKRLHGQGDYEGTGIGLAICRKIVERHGGKITAKSSPGEGATFIIELPVNRDRKSS